MKADSLPHTSRRFFNEPWAVMYHTEVWSIDDWARLIGRYDMDHQLSSHGTVLSGFAGNMQKKTSCNPLAGLTTAPSEWCRPRSSRATPCVSAKGIRVIASIAPQTSHTIMSAVKKTNVLQPAHPADHGSGGVDLGGGAMTMAVGPVIAGECYE